MCRARDRKVAGSMLELGITSLYPWERHFNANFHTGSLCGVEESAGVCFKTAYTGEKKNKKQADMALSVSPKVGLDNNCPMLNVNDVVPQVRRINRSN